MSWLKRIHIKNFIGISETEADLGKINTITGHKGSGKTSFVEAIEKAFTNKDRRVEVVKHGESEAEIFVQADDGLEINRKIRTDKAPYLKVSKPGETVPSTEAFLRKFINGDIFRPLEFIKKTPEEQAKIILDMLDIPWTMEDITTWFGEIPSDVNYEVHILKVLKQIENKYYEVRETVNREIKVLETQAKGYKDQLPPNYDGEYWREQKVQEYYTKVAQAEEINRKIAAARAIIDGLESKIDAIKANSETDKQTRKNAFDRQRSDGRDFIRFLHQKITILKGAIDGLQTKVETSCKAIDDSTKVELSKCEADYREELQALKDKYAAKAQEIKDKAETAKVNVKEAAQAEAENEKAEIAKHQNSIASKEQELLNIDELERQTLQAIDEKTVEQIKTVDAEAGNSKKIIEETQPVDVEPLKQAADEVALMQSYLRDYDLMKDILINKLAPKQQYSLELTGKIERARSLPMDLLKTASVPIPEINVDKDGHIRIGETLISDLSEGEQLELAFRVAKTQGGELKVIVLDGLNKINEADRKWIEEEMQKDEYQYFNLITTDGDMKIESK